MKGFNINDVDTKGATGLHYSCINGHPNVVFYLLSRNARIKADYFGIKWNLLTLILIVYYF